jgi:flagellar hook-associated protein 2
MSDFNLTTAQITSLVTAYTTTQNQTLVDPYTARQTKYKDMVSSLGGISTSLTALKGTLSKLQLTGSDSTLINKTVASSDDTTASGTASSAAVSGSYEITTNQLAKSDSFVSGTYANATVSSLTAGTHTFVIKTGDGSNPDFTSTVQVTFGTSETNLTAMQKIRNAINQDQAVVQSDSKTAFDSYAGGPATFKINLTGTSSTNTKGTDTVISVSGGGTYSDLIDEVVKNIKASKIDVTAQKVTDSITGKVSLKLTVNDNSNNISITNDSGFDVVSDLGIATTKEKSAAGLLSASTISTDISNSQFSLATKNSGLDYRIKSLSDSAGSSALDSIGLNLGTTRPAFDQSTATVTGGFVYPDTTAASNKLNAKFVFNGINIQRNSNAITDLVNGVTINLKGITTVGNPPAALTVGVDVTTNKANITSFISGFNSLYSLLKTDSDRTLGALYSDSNVTSMLSALSTTGSSAVSGIDPQIINCLSKIGISFSNSKGLSVSDDTLLTNCLTNKSSEVDSLFNSANGIANILYNKLNPYLGAGGYIQKSEDSINSNLKFVTDKITANKKTVTKSADDLRTKYENMQVQLAAMMQSQTTINSLFK